MHDFLGVRFQNLLLVIYYISINENGFLLLILYKLVLKTVLLLKKS